jgi:hypothetical protein
MHAAGGVARVARQEIALGGERRRRSSSSSKGPGEAGRDPAWCCPESA